jgi:hypothetical protein
VETSGTKINPYKTGLPADAPNGSSIILDGDRTQPDRAGRTVIEPSYITDAATPERATQPGVNAPAAGKPAGGRK